MKLQLLLLLILSILGCRRASDSKDERNDADTVTNVTILTPGTAAYNDSVNRASPDKNAFAEFGVTNGTSVLRLRDWRKDINLRALGTPNDSLSRVLGVESDTHEGSTVYEYKYNDLNLEFFGPKGNPDAWLMTIDVKGGPWSTARGIRIGDSFNDLKAMYPKATNEYSDDKGIYTYTLDDSAIQFGVTDDKVTRIKLMHNIP